MIRSLKDNIRGTELKVLTEKISDHNYDPVKSSAVWLCGTLFSALIFWICYVGYVADLSGGAEPVISGNDWLNRGIRLPLSEEKQNEYTFTE